MEFDEVQWQILSFTRRCLAPYSLRQSACMQNLRRSWTNETHSQETCAAQLPQNRRPCQLMAETGRRICWDAVVGLVASNGDRLLGHHT